MKYFSISEEINKLSDTDPLVSSILRKWQDSSPELSGFRNSGRLRHVKDMAKLDEDVRVHPRCLQVIVYVFGIFIQQLDNGVYVYDKLRGKGSIVNADLKFIEEEVFNNIKSLIKT